MDKNWTKVGEEYSRTPELRARFERAIRTIKWQTPPCTMGMMPAEAINTALREFRIPHVQRVGCSAELEPNGLLGIEARYKNGVARIYLVDSGTHLTPVVSDFEPKEALT